MTHAIDRTSLHGLTIEHLRGLHRQASAELAASEPGSAEHRGLQARICSLQHELSRRLARQGPAP